MAPPVFVSHVKKRKRIGDPRVRAHHIDTSELGHAHLDCSAAVVVDGNVANKLNAPLPQATGGGSQLLSVPIKGYYRRTFIKEAPYDRQADPLCCSSYNDALSDRTETCATPRLLVF